MGDAAPGPTGTPACTDSISSHTVALRRCRNHPGDRVEDWRLRPPEIVEIRKAPRNVDRRGRDLLQAFPSEQRIKRFEAQVPGTRCSWAPLPIWRICKAQKGRRAAASCA